MERTEIRKLVELEDRHWWYRERRAILGRQLRRLRMKPGVAIDIGAAGGGNTRVLKAHGWRAVAVEYGLDGAEVAKERGILTVRADARRLPFRSSSVDLVVAFDVLEHIEEDDWAVAEIERVLRPGGVALIAVPCDMSLWSEHDVAVGHVRRYTRESLQKLLTRTSGMRIRSMWSWNVLVRPIASWRRKRVKASDLHHPNMIVNAGLSAIIAAERYLPVRSLPGVSLITEVVKLGSSRRTSFEIVNGNLSVVIDKAGESLEVA